MEEVVEEPTLCTFALGQRNLIHQAIYICHTCDAAAGGATNECCCAGCASVCHAGHDVSFIAYGDAYCDCGAKGCQHYAASQSKGVEFMQLCSLSDSNNSETLRFHLNQQISPLPTRSFNIQGIDEHFHRLCNEAVLLAQGSKNTFWVCAAATEPRCALEALALRLLETHVKANNVDPAICGGEWWVQVKDSSQMQVGQADGGSGNDHLQPPMKSSSIDTFDTSSTWSKRRSRKGGIDMHYDKDEDVAEVFGVGIFPTLSTVTYLSQDTGALPTVIFENMTSTEVGKPIKRCYHSKPRKGKHLTFDGRYLHGAPHIFQPDEYPEEDEDVDNVTDGFLSPKKSMRIGYSKQQRITFLLNVWVNHKPANVQPISDELVSLCTQVTVRDNLPPVSVFKMHNLAVPPHAVSIAEDKVQQILVTEAMTETEDLGLMGQTPFVSEKSTWGKSEDETGLSIRYWRPNVVDMNVHSGDSERIQQWHEKYQELLLRQSNSGKKAGSKSKKGQKRSNAALSADTETTAKVPNDDTYEVVYATDAVAAFLINEADEDDYDTDEEMRDELVESMELA